MQEASGRVALAGLAVEALRVEVFVLSVGLVLFAKAVFGPVVPQRI